MRVAALGISAGIVALATSWVVQEQLRKLGVHCSALRYALLCWRLRRTDDLIIIADFDRTITTAACGISSHGVIESCKALSAGYRDATKQLLEHYYPIETDPHLTAEQKIPIMQEWYFKAHTLLLNEPLTESVLQSAADDAPIALRPGFVELLMACKACGVPFIVCSAGLGNVVRAVLRTRLPSEADVESLPIVSNWVRFHDPAGTGTICGFTEPLIHMYNKNAKAIQERLGEQQWRSITAGRRTVLLLGDSLGDATMADGMHDARVHKIGFLNENLPERIAPRIAKYRRAFDAVITGDPSMEWVRHVTKL